MKKTHTNKQSRNAVDVVDALRMHWQRATFYTHIACARRSTNTLMPSDNKTTYKKPKRNALSIQENV